MHFTVDQTIKAPLADTARALADPAFYETMGALGNISAPEVVGREQGDGGVRLRVRYRFVGPLAAPVRRVLDPDKMTWIIDTTIGVDSHHATFRLLPDSYANRIECAGTYRLTEAGPETTRRVTDADLVVHYPLVGGLVERTIVNGLREHLQDEAVVLERWVHTGS